LKFSSGGPSIRTIVKQVTWKHLYPANKLKELIQSSKPVVAFLDANDSDLSSYIVNTLRGDTNTFSYHANFYSMKQRQNALSQTLLSLLFLEANNIRTGKSFAEDFLTASQTPRRFVMKYKIPGRTGEVFEALLFGSPLRKQLSIKFLKCMTCARSELKKIGMYRDLRETTTLAYFFTDVMKCFKDKSAKVTRNFRWPMVVCFCDVPVEELRIVSLNESELEKIFNATIRSCVKLWLISRGNLNEYDTQMRLDVGDDLTPPIQFERVPLLYRRKFGEGISEVARTIDLTGLSRNIISEVDRQGNIASRRKIDDLISIKVLEKFLEILLDSVDEGLSVSKFSVDFSSLLELALQKDPNALTLENIKNEFLATML
jgi:hypothetical protein